MVAGTTLANLSNEVLDVLLSRSHDELALPCIEEGHDAVVLKVGHQVLGTLDAAMGLQDVVQLNRAERTTEVAVVKIAHGGSESGSRNSLHNFTALCDTHIQSTTD